MKKFKYNILLLVLLTIVVVFVSLKDDFNTTIDYIISANTYWFILAIIVMVGSILMQSLGLYVFVKRICKDFTVYDAFNLAACGLFFNAITPFSTGGQPFQIYLLNKRGVKVSDSTNAILQNFITYQMCLISIGLFAIVMNSIFNIFPENSVLKHIVLLGFLINVFVLLAIVFLLYAKKTNTNLFNKIIDFIFKFNFIKKKEQKRKNLLDLINNFYESSSDLKKNKKIIIKSILFNLCSLIMIYSIPFLVFNALSEDNLSFINSIVFSGYTYLIGSFVPIPGGTGGLEYAYNEFFREFSNQSLVTASMLLWRFLTYYLGMIVGGIMLFIQKKEVK